MGMLDDTKGLDLVAVGIVLELPPKGLGMIHSKLGVDAFPLVLGWFAGGGLALPHLALPGTIRPLLPPSAGPLRDRNLQHDVVSRSIVRDDRIEEGVVWIQIEGD